MCQLQLPVLVVYKPSWKVQATLVLMFARSWYLTLARKHLVHQEVRHESRARLEGIYEW